MTAAGSVYGTGQGGLGVLVDMQTGRKEGKKAGKQADRQADSYLTVRQVDRQRDRTLEDQETTATFTS